MKKTLDKIENGLEKFGAWLEFWVFIFPFICVASAILWVIDKFETND